MGGAFLAKSAKAANWAGSKGRVGLGGGMEPATGLWIDGLGDRVGLIPANSAVKSNPPGALTSQ